MDAMRMMKALVVAALASSSGCVESQLVDCADGRACPVGTVCDDAHGTCVDPDRLTACAGAADGDACDAVPDGVCAEGVCIAAGCGNGLVEPGRGERCDDGNAVSGDGCTADCASDERCGNGVLDTGEACDDGNALSHDGCASQCVREQAVWLEQQPVALGRELAASAYDAARGELVVFGGTVGGELTSETLIWRGHGWAGWFGRPAAQPSASRDSAMVFDAARGETILFGGYNGAPFNETWAWDGERWRQLAPTTAPPARSRHAMAYDAARRQIVMFGGASGVVGSTTYLGDTWVWDGAAWTAIETPGPSPRADHRMAYDPARGEIMLFGGEIDVTTIVGTGSTSSSGTYLADTWVWDGSTWQLVDDGAGSLITGRGRVGLAWNGAEVILHGGANWGAFSVSGVGGGQFYAPQPGTFRWDRAASAWAALTTTGGAPAHAAAFAGLPDGRLAMLAYNLATMDGDTWLLDGETWQLQAPTPGPVGGTHAAAYDPVHGQLLLTTTAATFAWDGGWYLVDAGVPPAGRMAFDPRRERLVVLAGAYDQLHEWTGSAWVSTTLDLPPSPPRSGAAYWIEPDGTSLVYGGHTVGPLTTLDDHWRLTGATWAALTPASSPGARSRAAVASTPTGAYVFGGLQDLGGYAADLWSWSGDAWNLVPPIGQAPGSRELASLTYLPTSGDLVLFGGRRNTTSFADTWAWSGGTWRRPVLEPPPPRYQHEAAYDARGRRLVMFGGRASAVWSDTWTYHQAADLPSEVCAWGRDLDGDGLVGCADPDCWGVCTPSCPPGATCDPDAPRCGDARCDAPRETARLCPECGPPAVTCGDFFCDPPETAASCPGDC